jgi:hypothetical protein
VRGVEACGACSVSDVRPGRAEPVVHNVLNTRVAEVPVG